MGDSYDGSPRGPGRAARQRRALGRVGQLVAADFKSSIVFVPLLDKNPNTGEALDYGELLAQIEALRAKYEQRPTSRIHVTGFAKLVGDLIDGLQQVLRVLRARAR